LHYLTHMKYRNGYTQTPSYTYSKVNFFLAPFVQKDIILSVWIVTIVALLLPLTLLIELTTHWLLSFTKLSLCITSLVGLYLYCRARQSNLDTTQIHQIIMTSLCVLSTIHVACGFWELRHLSSYDICFILTLLFFVNKVFSYNGWWSNVISRVGDEGITYHNFFTPEEVAAITSELDQAFSVGTFPPRKSDPTFGSFTSLEWSLRPDYEPPTQNPNPPPPLLSAAIKRLTALVPEQQFDLAFIHRYGIGDSVPAHKDPHQQLGLIILSPFGNWKGGVLRDTPTKKVVLDKAGDIALMRCRIPGTDRPLHEVTPISQGVRYSLMISTLIIPRSCKNTEKVEWQ